MNKQEQIDKVITQTKVEGHYVSDAIGDGAGLEMTMSQTISTKGKDVRIVMFKGGGYGLLVDGIMYKMEIMLYTGTDKNKTIKQAGMEIMDLGNGYLEVV